MMQLPAPLLRQTALSKKAATEEKQHFGGSLENW
jgi:hypothetical protein